MKGRLKSLLPSHITCLNLLLKIIQQLFPLQEKNIDSSQQPLDMAAIPAVTRDDQLEICGKIEAVKPLRLAMKPKPQIFAGDIPCHMEATNAHHTE